MTKPHRMPPANCPGCNTSLNGATNAEHGHTTRPMPGDITICVCCQSFLMFRDDLSFLLIDDKQLTRYLPPAEYRLMKHYQKQARLLFSNDS